MDKFRVFISCNFPPSNLVNSCCEVGKAIGLEMIIADNPATEEIAEKVRKAIFSSDAAIVVWEKIKGKSNDWLTAEYAIASAMKKPIGVIKGSKTKLPRTFRKDFEFLDIVNLDPVSQVIKITEYLFSLKNKLETTSDEIRRIDNPPYVRELIKHQTYIDKLGRVNYETHVKINCHTDILPLVKHSIHINQSSMENDSSNTLPFELLQLDTQRKCTKEIFATAKDKITFTVTFDPPLRDGDSVTYGWKTGVVQFLPRKSEEIDLIIKGLYVFPEGMAQHHYFINHPTKKLILQIEFEDENMVGDCEARAYSSRVFSTQTIDKSDTQRIQKDLEVNSFMGKKSVKLEIPKPKFGNNYAILYEMKMM